MRAELDLIKTHLIELKNAGVKSVKKAEILNYLNDIGIPYHKAEKVLNDAFRRQQVIPLKNRKITLNLLKK